MKYEVIIREAKKEDAPAILAVNKLAFRIYQSELHTNAPVAALYETEEHLLNDLQKNAVFAAEQGGKIIGSIRVEKLNRELAYIYHFGVQPEINNLGVGSGLMTAAVTYCLKEGCKAVALHTNTKYYKLARYYYGKEFYVHSTSADKGYIRALFIKDLAGDADGVDLSPAFAR